jgi:hypothetical protein
MKKKNWILTGLVVVIAASCFFIVGFSTHASTEIDNSTCCQKVKNCADKTNVPASGEMFLDNISRQFLSVSSLVY